MNIEKLISDLQAIKGMVADGAEVTFDDGTPVEAVDITFVKDEPVCRDNALIVLKGMD